MNKFLGLWDTEDVSFVYSYVSATMQQITIVGNSNQGLFQSKQYIQLMSHLDFLWYNLHVELQRTSAANHKKKKVSRFIKQQIPQSVNEDASNQQLHCFNDLP
jgi:hypothetical protein